MKPESTISDLIDLKFDFRLNLKMRLPMKLSHTIGPLVHVYGRIINHPAANMQYVHEP